MANQGSDVAWLDASHTVGVTELSRITALTAAELEELIDYGALSPVSAGGPELVFSAEWVMPLRTVGKLRRDFDLEIFAAGILLEYLLRIDALEGQLRAAGGRMPQGQ